ncbi:uncharacterized protein SCHCODRAFT_02673626 [Schizophyllum commune H4-8]|uniref:Expressed protein n=1 Tax=Schizophyllum commune (strain H4-8 / FGSC 9210) TaxID=578458 RepID=D8QKS6_SCHCM|nr:uncharacterized protein SCHCODRAFT_02673626 [Schizophyllum commune H4-8]KAI5885445.1 hypothetical protein SCHCODRAFT_02673626 [Schizophyllum commune H4-8]
MPWTSPSTFASSASSPAARCSAAGVLTHHGLEAARLGGLSRFWALGVTKVGGDLLSLTSGLGCLHLSDECATTAVYAILLLAVVERVHDHHLLAG